MIADQLKKAVLQAAIQGKLTEQLPGDGGASELLAEILAEKDRLIREGKLKKEKPLPLITENEIPFAIPDNWCWVRLCDIGLIIGGGTPKTNEKINWDDGHLPWITPADMKNFDGKYVSSGERFITNYGLIHSSAQLMPKGSVLFSSRAPIGYLAISKNPLCTNQGFKSVVPFNINMSEFIYYSLLAFTKDIQKLGSGTTFKEVSGSVMKQICIPLPPLSEQQRIVDKLDEILPELEKLSQDEIKLEELQKSFPQQLKSSLLQAAIQGKLTDQLPEDGNVLDLLEEIKAEKQHLISAGKLKKEKPLPPITEDEIPFEIPDNWFWVRYSDVFSIGSSRRVHERDWRSKGVPYYRAREIAVLAEKGYIDNELFIDIEFYEKLKSESGVPKSGDLMVTGVGTLGKTYVVKEADKFYYKDACVLCVSNFGSIFSNYIKLFIEAPFMKDQINSNSSGTTVSTLTISRFNKYLLALPPYEEQKRIVDRLQVLLPLCDALD